MHSQQQCTNTQFPIKTDLDCKALVLIAAIIVGRARRAVDEKTHVGVLCIILHIDAAEADAQPHAVASIVQQHVPFMHTRRPAFGACARGSVGRLSTAEPLPPYLPNVSQSHFLPSDTLVMVKPRLVILPLGVSMMVHSGKRPYQSSHGQSMHCHSRTNPLQPMNASSPGASS